MRLFPIKVIVIACVWVPLLIGFGAAAAAASGAEPAPAVLRFAVQGDRIEAAWRQFDADSGGGEGLKNRLGSNARAEFFAEAGKAVYFDTPSLGLLKSGRALQYLQVWPAGEAPNPPDAEWVIVETARGEVPALEAALAGIDVVHSGRAFKFVVTHYRSVATSEDKHPLLKLVPRGLRATFQVVLGLLGVEHPFALGEVFEALHRRAGFDLFQGQAFIGRIALDVATVSRFGIGASVAGVSFTPADDGPAEGVQAAAGWLREHFEDSRLEDGLFYQTGFAALEKKLPILGVLLEFPIVKRVGEAVLFTLMGIVVFLLFCGRRVFKKGGPASP